MAFNAKDILAKAKQDAEEKAKKAEADRLAALEAEKQRAAQETEEKARQEREAAKQREKERKAQEEKERKEQEEREKKSLEEKMKIEAEKARVQEELRQKAEAELKRNTAEAEAKMNSFNIKMQSYLSNNTASSWSLKKELDAAKEELTKNVNFDDISCYSEFKENINKLEMLIQKTREKEAKKAKSKKNAKTAGIVLVCLVVVAAIGFGIYKLTTRPKEQYVVGGKGQGGVIFYDKGEYSDGWRYLECSLVYLGETYYCKDKTMITGLSSTLGGGDFNTDNLILIKGDDTAAAKARAYKGGGYEDWYLPNRVEATTMYKALTKGKGKKRAAKINGFEKIHQGFFESPSIWTSEMYNSDKAYYLSTDSNGGSVTEGWVYTYNFMGMELTSSHSLRPIRKF